MEIVCKARILTNKSIAYTVINHDGVSILIGNEIGLLNRKHIDTGPEEHRPFAIQSAAKVAARIDCFPAPASYSTFSPGPAASELYTILHV